MPRRFPTKKSKASLSRFPPRRSNEAPRSVLAKNNVNTISRQILDTIKVTILASAVVLSMQYVFAWSGAPASGPPNDNVDPPVNVSNNSQVKLGEFGVNKLTAGYVES